MFLITPKDSVMTVPNITFDPQVLTLCAGFRVGVIRFDIQGTKDTDLLYNDFDDCGIGMKRYNVSDLKERPAIKATRLAYKAFGKDPNRYRPAAEQLGRRLLNDLGLYRVSPLVDFGNLISLSTGFSVGLFDFETIQMPILFRVGIDNDVFEGIGRGIMNIAGLPVYCDEHGPFATPTSDHERTKIQQYTSKVLMFINDFGSQSFSTDRDLLADALAEVKLMLPKYFDVVAFETNIESPVL